MTNESAKDTEPWIAAKDAQYPYAYDKGGLKNELGVSGIPAAFLVSPDGVIVWEGHPGSLTDKIIEENLKGVLQKPLYEWPESAKKVKSAFLKRDFSGAIKAAKQLAANDEFGGEAAEFLQTMVTERVEGIEAAITKGDILSAVTASKALSKGLKGMPEEAVVKAALKRVTKDKQMKGWLKAQEKAADILSEDMRRKKDCEAAIKGLEKLLKGNEDSFVGDQIEASISALKKKAGKLR